jgi:hypothetical protein
VRRVVNIDPDLSRSPLPPRSGMGGCRLALLNLDRGRVERDGTAVKIGIQTNSCVRHSMDHPVLD